MISANLPTSSQSWTSCKQSSREESQKTLSRASSEERGSQDNHTPTEKCNTKDMTQTITYGLVPIKPLPIRQLGSWLRILSSECLSESSFKICLHWAHSESNCFDLVPVSGWLAGTSFELAWSHLSSNLLSSCFSVNSSFESASNWTIRCGLSFILFHVVVLLLMFTYLFWRTVLNCSNLKF